MAGRRAYDSSPISAFVAPFLIAAGAVVSACSGAAATGLFNEGSNAETDAGAHPVKVDASVPASDASVDPPQDASIPVPDSAPQTEDASKPDTSIPNDNPGIKCGNAYCQPGSDVCCRIDNSIAPTFMCLPPAGCPKTGALAVTCDDAADCEQTSGDGDVCCVTQNAQTGRAESVECMPAAQCASGLQTNMCDGLSADPCPNGGTCKPSQTTIPGYDICI